MEDWHKIQNNKQSMWIQWVLSGSLYVVDQNGRPVAAENFQGIIGFFSTDVSISNLDLFQVFQNIFQKYIPHLYVFF